MSPASKKAKPLSENQSYSPNFIHYCFYALFFVTPLLLWPFTSEVFEFNKMLFVYAMTIIIAAAWTIQSFQIKRFEIARTPLDLPLILFVTSQVASTIFSIDRHTSLWGYYSRFHGGLVSTFCYVILFYALVTHFQNQTKAIKNLLTAILSSATFISLTAILEHFGHSFNCLLLTRSFDVNCWVQDVQNRVFSSLGQPNWLSAYIIALLPISLFSALRAKHWTLRITHYSLSLLFLTAILFTRSQSGIGATAIIILAFTVITLIQKKQTKVLPALALVLLVILFLKSSAVIRALQSLNKTNPFYSDTETIVTQENETRIGGSDSMTIRRVVWQGAIDLGKKYPFFGTGVETFGYSYYWVRPAIHNLTSEDNFLYNKAHNEYLNFLATTGFFGLLTYLFLIFSIIRVLANRHSRPDRESIPSLSNPLLLGFTSILITNYFGFSVVNIALFFFLFPAIYISTLDNNKTISIKINLHQTLSTVFILALSFWLLLGVRRLWQADLAYVDGRSNLAKNLEAIKKNPSEPLYYAQLGNVQSLVATQIIAPQIKELPATTSAEIKAQANSYLNQYVQEALKNTSQAVSMNKYNLNLLKTKARTELTLAQLDPKYNSDAIQTLLKITEFSPTEAINYFNVGILYAELDQNDQAKLAFQKALQLKPDYQAAQDHLEQLMIK